MSTVVEADRQRRVARLDQLRAEVGVVADLALWDRRAEQLQISPADAVDEVGDPGGAEPLVDVIMAGEDGVGAPLGEGPLHLAVAAVGGGRGVRRVMAE